MNSKCFLCLLILFSNLAFSQSLTSLESTADKTRNQIIFENTKLDSLNKVINQKADVINKEKSKQPQDEDKISRLMANSILVTNQIEGTQKRISELEEKLSSTEKQLYYKYKSAIDSLTVLLNKSNSKSEKDKITYQIFSLREKRIYLTQGNLKLSYNPENILKIDTRSFSNQNDKKKIEEYLTNAYAEASSQLKNVSNKLEEIDKTTSLQKKANRFLEQTESESELKATTKFSKQTEATNSYKDGRGANDVSMEMSAVNYNQVFNQLSFLEPSLIKSKQDNTIKKNFQIKDYRKLLSDIKQLLTEYNYLLQNKINALK